MKYYTVMGHALATFDALAPNETAKAAMRRTVADMEIANEAMTDIVLAVAHAIVDGVKHGNWQK